MPEAAVMVQAATTRPAIGLVEACDLGVFHLEQSGGKGFGPVRLHDVQRSFLAEMFDTYVDDRRRYRQGVYSVVKKFGKTSTAALVGLWHLLFDDTETNREIASLAGDIDQARVSLDLAKRIIRQSPRLQTLEAERLLVVNKNEIEYHAPDGQLHIWQAIASNAPTAHGMNPSLVLVDEGWQLRDYDLLEAVSLGPQRKHPVQLWSTYAGFKASMVEGNPLYDLYTRGMAKTDPTLHMLWLSGEDAYKALPPGFIRPGYLDEQRRLLPPNKFQRLHLNQWGAADASFLTEQDIARATVDLPIETRSALPHVLACDYGRSHDHTAVVVARPDPGGRLRVVNAVAIKGTRANPVALETVEQQITAWVRQYAVERVIIDPFQMLGSAERLAKPDALNLPIVDGPEAERRPWRKAIVLQTINPSYLNRLTTGMLGAFRSGMVLIPSALIELLDQLGAVVVRETYYGVRIDSGVGVGVRGHDDLAIATGMALVDCERRRGQRPATAGFRSVNNLL